MLTVATPPPQPPADEPGSRSPWLYCAGTILTALFGAIALPGHAAGLNVSVTALLLFSSAWTAARRDLDRVARILLLLAISLMSGFTLRTATWVLTLDAVAALFLGVTGFSRARTWATIVGSMGWLLRQLPRGFVFALRPVVQLSSSDHVRKLLPAARGALLSLAAVVVFGTLFVSADRAFASLAEDFLIPEWDVRLIPGRILTAIVCVSLAGAFVLVSPAMQLTPPSPWVLDQLPAKRLELQPPEWKTLLLAVDLLFASFVAVQIAVLFGGHDHVLQTTGLTYSEYARQGFFQLVIVAFLTLALVAAAIRYGRLGANDRRLMQALLGILCLSTLVILVSALTRINLYQQAYGFTRPRLLVEFTILWIAGVFVLLIVAGAVWDGRWFPRAVLALSAAALLAFNLCNPDAVIAERNVERFVRTGETDLAYLTTLSLDATAGLDNLPEPQRSCVIRAITATTDTTPSFWSFNLSRTRALDALEEIGPAPLGSVAQCT